MLVTDVDDCVVSVDINVDVVTKPEKERLDGACYSREEKTCPSERVDMFVSM
uniref:Uncharacterized protein n=1 Tax=Peronospora matthiolae TaxID=2874970 RepID=A0AAV1T672_9STRA